jgi:hypothetical protein
MNDDTTLNLFHPDRLRIDVAERRAVTPARIRRRRKHFMPFPVAWYERLKGANGQTYRVALFLCYESWKQGSETMKVPNGMLKIDGVSPQSKRRALGDLARRGCIAVEWRPKKSPIARLLP